jgi:hypothetical protein
MAINDVYLRPDAGDGANSVRLRTDAPDASSSNATLAWTEQDDVNALTAAVSQSATIAWTESDDVTAIAAEASSAEVIDWTSENDITAITANSAGTSADADLAWTEGDDVTDIQVFVDPAILIFDGHDGKPFKEKKPKWQHDKEHNDKRRATIAESIYGKPVVVAKKIAPLAKIQTTDDDEESVLMLML